MSDPADPSRADPAPPDAEPTETKADAPADAVMDLIFGRWRSQTLHAGVKLGVFEALAEGPMAAAAVAEALGLDPDNTYRLMRALGALDLLEERPDGTFDITDKGALLTKDHPQSLRGIALLEEGPVHYDLWTYLEEFVRTGEEDAFEKEHGHPQFEYLHREVDPEYSRVFDEAMTSLSRMETQAVLAVLELPKVVDAAGPVPEEVGVADRIAFTAGDMFEAVPEADGYLMKHILHDWGDEACAQILNNIRAAAPAGTPVFVAELVVPGPNTPHFAKLFDIHMMVATGGRERTVGEYEALFERAGMELVAHHKAEGPPMSVVEGLVPR